MSSPRRAPWARRAAETFAVIELVPEWSRRVARFFAENPNLMRLLGLAGHQYREG